MKIQIHNYERVGQVVGGALLSSLVFWGFRYKWFLSFGKTRKTEKDLANEYFPVQSTSERAAGHPIVGVS